MSKEKILEKHYPEFDEESGWMFDGPVKSVFDAMDEYAAECVKSNAGALCNLIVEECDIPELADTYPTVGELRDIIRLLRNSTVDKAIEIVKELNNGSGTQQQLVSAIARNLVHKLQSLKK